jgi:hypothetical protein
MFLRSLKTILSPRLWRFFHTNQQNKDIILATPQQKSREKVSATRLASISGYAQLIQSIFTTLAIICAGGWFFLQGEAGLRANLSQTVVHRRLDAQWTLVHVAIKIANEGKRRITLTSGFVRIQQVLPLDKQFANTMQQGVSLVESEKGRIPWPIVGMPYERALYRQIEPGEEDYLNFDFIVPSVLKTIQVYSYFKKREHHQIGLEAITLYDLPE